MRKPHETDVSPERPLVTFALFAYNQEKYIKSAVEAALAQTYTPLEIIVSDDASTDRTFEICSEVVARYTGPHTVKLNRNPRNVGLASHVNRMLEMSRGELLVMAAGDDVSVPERTEVLVQHWLQAGRPSAVCSSVYILQGDLPAVASNASSVEDLQWTSLQQHASDKISLLSWLARFPLRGLTGCAAAWSKHVFSSFGPFDAGVFCEDALLTLRSSMLQGISFIRSPLVFYRHHDVNLWSRASVPRLITTEHWLKSEERETRRQSQLSALYVNMLRDVDMAEANNWISVKEARPLRQGIASGLFETAVRCVWWNRGLLWRFVHFGCTKGTMKTRLLYLLPLGVYCRSRAMAAQLRSRVTVVSKSVKSL